MVLWQTHEACELPGASKNEGIALEHDVMMERKDEHAAGSREAVVEVESRILLVAVVVGVAVVRPDRAVAEAAQRALEEEQAEASSRLVVYSAVSVGRALLR